MEQTNQQGVKMYYSRLLAADYNPRYNTGVTIEVTKYDEKSYGQFTFSNEMTIRPDHLTVARWHVKPKPVDVAIANIITSAAKSYRS